MIEPDCPASGRVVTVGIRGQQLRRSSQTSRARGPFTTISGEATRVVACTTRGLKARSVIASIASAHDRRIFRTRRPAVHRGLMARTPGGQRPARGGAGLDVLQVAAKGIPQVASSATEVSGTAEEQSDYPRVVGLGRRSVLGGTVSTGRRGGAGLARP